MRKPNPKSKLKTLPPERQEEIYEYLCTHSLRDTVEWLRTQELHTHYSSVREFFRWYPLTATFHAAGVYAHTIRTALQRQPDLGLKEAELIQAGHAVFEAQALAQGDPKLFVALRKLRQADRILQLQENNAGANRQHKEQQLVLKDRDQKSRDARWIRAASERILEVARDPKTRAIADDSKMSRAEKIAAIRKSYFADVDAEEVILPP